MDYRVPFYLITLGVYGLGLYRLILRRVPQTCPVLFCWFLGTFLLDGIGVIFVMYPPEFAAGEFYSDEYLLQVNLFALLFYVLIWAYAPRRRRSLGIRLNRVARADRALAAFLLAAIVTIVGVFFLVEGPPTLLKVFDGSLRGGAAIAEHRQRTYYGSPGLPIWSLGLALLPGVLAVMAVLMGVLLNRRAGAVCMLLLVFCLATGALIGGKGSSAVNVVLPVAMLAVAGAGRLPPRSYRRILAVGGSTVLVGAVVTAVMYSVYLPGVDSEETVQRGLHRVFVAYAEGHAAAIRRYHVEGAHNGRTLPRYGLLTHEPIAAGTELYRFVSGGTGAISHSALAIGYGNFGWPGFLLFFVLIGAVLVGVEEILCRLPGNTFTLALLTLCCYFGFRLAYSCIFAVFLSLHKVTVVAALLWIRLRVLAVLDQPPAAGRGVRL